MAKDAVPPDVGADADDDELDLGRAVAAAATSPLHQAASRLRAGTETEDEEAAPPATDEKEAEGTEDEEAAAEEPEPEADEAEAEPAEEAEAEEGKEGEEGKDEEEVKGKAKEKLYDLVVPPIARDGPRSKVELELEGLPQEYRDLLQGHINRSRELDGVREELTLAREREALADFVETQPLAALLWLDQQDRSKGKQAEGIGREFFRLYAAQFPEEAIAELKKLGLGDLDEVDMERLADKGEAAKIKAERAVERALRSQGASTAMKSFIAEASGVIRSLAAQLDLDDETLRDFAAVAGNRIKQASTDRKAQGQDPRLSRSQLLQVLQPVAQRFAANGARGRTEDRPAPSKGKPTQTPAEAAAEMARRHNVATTHRKTGTGKQVLPPVSPSGLKKLKAMKGGVREVARAVKALG